MLLIDALYINDGGGKTLLDILIAKLQSRNINTIYLLDDRIAEEYKKKGLKNVTYMKSSLVKRHIFYQKNKSIISSVLAFGNIPPTVKLNCPTYTYFHNALYIENKTYNDIKLNIIFIIKKTVIKLLKRNTLKWIVQSEFIRTNLSNKWNIMEDDILVMPIFDDSKIKLPLNNKKRKPINSKLINFLYISDGHSYKNHYRLIRAFSKYNFSYPKSSLTLTISDKYLLLKEEIQKLKNTGINIIDRGIISRDQVCEEYLKADILFFPSLCESFGLPLIEAALYDLPIVTAKLPYVYEIINPNAVFDPLSVESIHDQMCKAEYLLQSHPIIVCKNCLEELISEISKKTLTQQQQ